MISLRKFSQISALLLLGILLVLLSLYALLLVINWQDETPSADALLFQSVLTESPAVDDRNNGYQHLLKNSDPAKLSVSETFNALQKECDQGDCHAALIAAKTELPVLIAEHQALLDFYHQLQSFKHWQETQLTHHSEIPSYQPLMNAHRLYLVQVWLSVQEGDFMQAKQLLQSDLLFWRFVLSHNGYLLSSMISHAALHRHFTFSQMLLESLEPEQQIALAPTNWQKPFSDEELSLKRAYAGEWSFSNGYIQEMIAAPLSDLANSWQERVYMWFSRPFLLPQATANHHATLLLACEDERPQQEIRWYQWVYNPLGKLINEAGSSYCNRYSLQEIEQQRQETIARFVNLTLN